MTADMGWDPSHPPMMGCGHRANATQTMSDGSRRPVCVICAGISGGRNAEIVEEPDLSDRQAICSYADKDTGIHTGRLSGHPYEEQPVDGPVASSLSAEGRLAFFERKPDEKFDRYFCGCMGWD